MKQGAIFDMDGLLTDTERYYSESWMATAEAFGQAWVPGFEKAVAGTSGETMLAVIREYFPAADARAFMDYCVEASYRLGWENLREMPGATEMLKFCQARGIRTAIASSSPLEVIRRYVKKLEWEPLINTAASGHEVERGKPFPDVFLLAAERLGVAPEDCYVFEDGVNGCRAGIAAGCATVMIPDLFQPTDDIRAGCAGIYPSLTEARRAIADGRL